MPGADRALAVLTNRVVTGLDGLAAAVSRVEAHVLHVDNFPAFVLGDGVPDGHVVGGQVQFVGAGQWVVAREGVREGRDRLVQ